MAIKRKTTTSGLKVTTTNGVITGGSDSSGSFSVSNGTGSYTKPTSTSKSSSSLPKTSSSSKSSSALPKTSTTPTTPKPSRYAKPLATPNMDRDYIDPTGASGAFVGGYGVQPEQPVVDKVSRYAKAPVAPLNLYEDERPQLGKVDEKSIREQTRKRMQSSIDAINANYSNLIAQEKVQGEDRSGQTRALNARSGTIGSDFGQAQQEKTTTYNKQQTQYLADQQNQQIQSVMTNIEDRASAEIQNKKNEALGKYEMDMQEYESNKQSARQDFELLAKSGVDLATMNPNQKAALFKQAGYDEGMGEVIYNALKPKPQQIAYETVNVGGGRVLFYGVDPVTGELKQQIVDAGVPDDWSMTIAPDGTPIGFNKNTGETQILGNRGEFAKPVDTASEFLDNPKKQAAFNSIVNKYNASPLIAASDRTVVLKNTIDQVRQDPSNAAQQLNLSYAYIQALDTYQSAVREGELGIVNSIDSKVGQLQNYISQMQNGQIVRPEVAKQIADAADQLVKTISEGAKQKEQVFASQARVNGIEDAWNDFRSGFVTNYDDAGSDQDLNDLFNQTVSGSQSLDLNKALQSGGLTFNKAGNASASNQVKTFTKKLSPLPLAQSNFSPMAKLPKAIESIPTIANLSGNSRALASATATKFAPNSTGGQCGIFVRKVANSFGLTYPRLGDSLTSKMNAVAKYGTSIKNARPGSVIVTKENPTYGHVAWIIGKNANGYVVAESNFKQSEKVSYGRIIPFNSPKIVGVINPTKA